MAGRESGELALAILPPVPQWAADYLKKGGVVCVECDEAAFSGRRGDVAGTIYSWHDSLPRCHSCRRKIERGEMQTRVQGSPISTWYTIIRTESQARQKKVVALFVGDYLEVQMQDVILSKCHFMRQRIIAEFLRARRIAVPS